MHRLLKAPIRFQVDEGGSGISELELLFPVELFKEPWDEFNNIHLDYPLSPSTSHQK